MYKVLKLPKYQATSSNSCSPTPSAANPPNHGLESVGLNAPNPTFQKHYNPKFPDKTLTFPTQQEEFDWCCDLLAAAADGPAAGVSLL